MAIFTQSVTAADVLSGITTDDTKWAGANLDTQLSTMNTNIQSVDTDVNKMLPIYKIDIHDLVNNSKYYAVSGTWASRTAGAMTGGRALSNTATGAQNDEIALSNIYFPEDGDYTAYIMTWNYDDCGIVTLEIDGSSEGTVDTYDGSGVGDATDTITLSSMTKGLHNLNLKMATKNASSSAYKLNLQGLVVVKA